MLDPEANNAVGDWSEARSSARNSSLFLDVLHGSTGMAATPSTASPCSLAKRAPWDESTNVFTPDREEDAKMSEVSRETSVEPSRIQRWAIDCLAPGSASLDRPHPESSG